MPRVLNYKRDGLPDGAVYVGRALRGNRAPPSNACRQNDWRQSAQPLVQSSWRPVCRSSDKGCPLPRPDRAPSIDCPEASHGG